jgi:hypothetical protein
VCRYTEVVATGACRKLSHTVVSSAPLGSAWVAWVAVASAAWPGEAFSETAGLELSSCWAAWRKKRRRMAHSRDAVMPPSPPSSAPAGWTDSNVPALQAGRAAPDSARVLHAQKAAPQHHPARCLANHAQPVVAMITAPQVRHACRHRLLRPQPGRVPEVQRESQPLRALFRPATGPLMNTSFSPSTRRCRVEHTDMPALRPAFSPQVPRLPLDRHTA